MGTKQEPKDEELYRRVDEVLHYIWDPIGVSGVPQARDEYNSYLPSIFQLVKDESSADDMAIDDWLRTLRRCGGAALLFAHLLASHAHAFERCKEVDMVAPEFSLVLKGAERDRNGVFVGLFEFRNVDLAPSVKIVSNGKRQVHFVARPDAIVEFKDLNGRWRQIEVPIEEYLGGNKTFSVAARSTVRFKAHLFHHGLVEHDGSDFRLILYLSTPKMCIASLPFRAYPLRPRVEKFLSITGPR